MFVIGKNLPEVLKPQNEVEFCCASVVSAGTGGLEEGEIFQNNTLKYDRLYLQSRGAYTLYMHPNLPVYRLMFRRGPKSSEGNYFV